MYQSIFCGQNLNSSPQIVEGDAYGAAWRSSSGGIVQQKPEAKAPVYYIPYIGYLWTVIVMYIYIYTFIWSMVDAFSWMSNHQKHIKDTRVFVSMLFVSTQQQMLLETLSCVNNRVVVGAVHLSWRAWLGTYSIADGWYDYGDYGVDKSHDGSVCMPWSWIHICHQQKPQSCWHPSTISGSYGNQHSYVPRRSHVENYPWLLAIKQYVLPKSHTMWILHPLFHTTFCWVQPQEFGKKYISNVYWFVTAITLCKHHIFSKDFIAINPGFPWDW